MIALLQRRGRLALCQICCSGPRNCPGTQLGPEMGWGQGRPSRNLSKLDLRPLKLVRLAAQSRSLKGLSSLSRPPTSQVGRHFAELQRYSRCFAPMRERCWKSQSEDSPMGSELVEARSRGAAPTKPRAWQCRLKSHSKLRSEMARLPITAPGGQAKLPADSVRVDSRRRLRHSRPLPATTVPREIPAARSTRL